MNSAVERRNKQVWEALDAENYKQALQLCTKRLKKGEQGDYLHALKAYALTRSAAAGQRQDGLGELRALVDKVPPIVDVDTLNLVQQALVEYADLESSWNGEADIQHHVDALWERAMRARPGDEDLSKQWFFSAFQKEDWKNAQKAAMSLQRSSPQKRAYYFWAIVCSHMLNLSCEASASDRQLFGTLAYRMISKAASDVPSDLRVVLSTGRSIQTPQELHLLLSIYRRQGFKTEAVKILDSANLGINSTAAKGDWSFVRIKLDLLAEQEMWQVMWDFCESLLEKARQPPQQLDNGWDGPRMVDFHGDDWKVWHCLTWSCREINSSETRAATRQVATLYLEHSPKSRNARLGQLAFLASELSLSTGDRRAAHELTEACKRYFDDTASKTCCFDDLRTYVELFDGNCRDDFLEHVDSSVKRKEPKDTSQEGLSTAWTLARINSQKFIFLLRISRRPQDSKRDVLEAFIGSAIEMYKSTLSLGADLVPTDNQPGDDACILAVMGLVHLARMDSREAAKGSSIHLLQAAALLEHLLSRSKHNYQALLMLVRIYILLGAGSVASEVYPRLAIKQIQNDTLSYNILSRISTLHPHTVVTSIKPVDTADLEPELGLKRALGIYDRSESQIPDMRSKALEEGSYDQIEGFSDFGRRVKRSICKAMWHLERRRVVRLGSQGVSARKAGPMNLLGSELSDNRDRKVIPSCEASELPSFEELIRIGPEPKHEWVRVFVLSEQITDGIERGLEDTTGSPPVPRAEVAAQAQRLRDTLGSKSLKNEATAAEFVHLELQTTLADALMVLLEGSRGKNEAIVEKLRDIQLWLTKRLENQDSEDSSSHLQDLDLNAAPKLVGWSFFHDSFLALDGLIGVLSLLKTLAKRPKAARNAMCKEEEGKTQKLAEQLHLSIRSRAARTRNSLSESGVVGGLVDAAFARQNDKKTPVGSAIEDLVGEAWMERFASGVSESWQEALDGILRVKIS